MNQNVWYPPFHDTWFNIKAAAYKIVFEQAEKRFEDVLSESESITNKALKILVIVGAMFSFFVSSIVGKNIQVVNRSVLFLALFFIVVVGGIVWLLFPKNIKMRGLPPIRLMPADLDSEEDKERQEEYILYRGILLLQNNIDFMLARNRARARLYLGCQIGTLILLVWGATFILISI